MFFQNRRSIFFAKFTEKHLRGSVFFNKVTRLQPATFCQKKDIISAHVFSCGFYENFKNTSKHLLLKTLTL